MSTIGLIFDPLPAMISMIFSLLLGLHPIHVTVSEVTYSEKDKAIQIMSRVFIDDLETGIRRKRNEPELDIIEPKNGHKTDEMVLEYLNDHFKITLDGKPQKLSLLGHETEDAAIILYIEIKNVKKIKTLEVYDDVITEVHDDQSNLVHVTYKGPVKSARLMKDKPSETFRFEQK